MWNRYTIQHETSGNALEWTIRDEFPLETPAAIGAESAFVKMIRKQNTVVPFVFWHAALAEGTQVGSIVVATVNYGSHLFVNRLGPWKYT